VSFAVVLALLIPGVEIAASSQTAGADTTPPALLPAAGQFVPIVPTLLMDTRSGFGLPSSGNIAANGSAADIQVTGAGNGEIPSAGVSAVDVSIQVLSTSAQGYVTDFASDIADPGHAALSFQDDQAVSGSDIVEISTPGDDSAGGGTITFVNHSSGSISLAVKALGFFYDASINGTTATAGDTYVGVNGVSIIDTRSGLGGQSTPLGSEQSLQITDELGYVGVPPSAVDAVELEIGTIDAPSAGYLSLGWASGASGLRDLSYNAGETDRETLVIQVPTGSSGPEPITLSNLGTSAANVQVILRGYYVKSSFVQSPGAVLPTSQNSVATYVPLTPATVCDTRSGCNFDGGPTQYELSADQSINIQETGVLGTGIPGTGVSYVANEINAVSPTAAGYLTVNPYGTGTPSSASVVNFVGGDSGDASFDDSVVTPVSWSTVPGAITITNESSGSVQVVVSARGYWATSSVPTEPNNVTTAYDYTNSDVNVSWQLPDSDGSSPITGYDVLDNGSVVDAIGPGTFSAAVPAGPGDAIAVEAVNAFGQSPPPNDTDTADDEVGLSQAFDQATTGTSAADSDTAQNSVSDSTAASLPVIWSGSVTDPSGAGLQATVTAYATVMPQVSSDDTSTASQPIIPLATATTGDNGSFTLQAAPTTAILSLGEGTGGIFDVYIFASTDSQTTFYEEPMFVASGSGQVGSGEGEASIESGSGNILSPTGDDSGSWAMSWDPASDGSSVTPPSDGGQIVVATGSAAPTNGAVSDNLPMMGVIGDDSATSYSSASLAIGSESCGPWGGVKAQGLKWVSQVQLAVPTQWYNPTTGKDAPAWRYGMDLSSGTTSSQTMSLEQINDQSNFSINAGDTESSASQGLSNEDLPGVQNQKPYLDAAGQMISDVIFEQRLQTFGAKCYSHSEWPTILACAQQDWQSRQWDNPANPHPYPTSFIDVWFLDQWHNCFNNMGSSPGSFVGYERSNQTGKVIDPYKPGLWPVDVFSAKYAFDNEPGYTYGYPGALPSGYCTQGAPVDNGALVSTTQSSAETSENSVNVFVGSTSTYSVGVSAEFVDFSETQTEQEGLTATDTNGTGQSASHELWLKNLQGNPEDTENLCASTGFDSDHVETLAQFFEPAPSPGSSVSSQDSGAFVGNVGS
jgi:hypothetical protein